MFTSKMTLFPKKKFGRVLRNKYSPKNVRIVATLLGVRTLKITYNMSRKENPASFYCDGNRAQVNRGRGEHASSVPLRLCKAGDLALSALAMQSSLFL